MCLVKMAEIDGLCFRSAPVLLLKNNKMTFCDRDERLILAASLLLLSTASYFRSEDTYTGFGYLACLSGCFFFYLKAFWEHPTNRTTGGRPKTNWGDYFSQLDWERLRTTQEEQKEPGLDFA